MTFFNMDVFLFNINRLTVVFIYVFMYAYTTSNRCSALNKDCA